LGCLFSGATFAASDLDIYQEDPAGNATSAGSTDVPILSVRFRNPNGGGQQNETVTAMSFTANNTANADVTQAKLYWTSTSGTFATTTLLGTDTDVSNGIDFTFAAQTIVKGNNSYYFWLAYDVAGGATDCNDLDATQVSGDITTTGIINSYTDNSTGSVKIVGYACSWTGAVSDDWGNTGNWTSGSLPTATTDVFIPAAATNMPLISGDVGLCNNISIQASASITIVVTSTTNTLKTYGNITNNGTWTFKDCTGGPMLINGDCVISGTGTWALSGASNAYGGFDCSYNVSGITTTLQKDIDNINWLANSIGLGNGHWDMNDYNTTVYDFYFSAGETTSCGTGTFEFNHASPNFFSGTHVFNEETGLIYADITDAADGSWDFFGTQTFNNVRVRMQNGRTAHIGGAGGSCDFNGYFWGEDNGGTQDMHMDFSSDVEGYFRIGNGVTWDGSIIANWTLNLGGDWINDGTFTSGTSHIVFDHATADQDITGTAATTYRNLYCDKAAGGLYLQRHDTGVDRLFDLDNGPVFMNGHPLVLNCVLASSQTWFTRTNGYLVSESEAAELRWNMNNLSAHTYHFGTSSGTYIPYTFTASTLSGVFGVATWTTASNNTPWASGVGHMFDPTLNQDGSDEAVIDRWWMLDDESGGMAASDMQFTYPGAENTMDPAYNTGLIGAQRWNGTGWDANLGSATAVTAGTGTVSTGAWSSFSPWVLSSIAAPLPVEWLGFTATPNGNQVDLQWETANEIHNDHFVVQRSANGIDYEDLMEVSAVGTSTTITSYFEVDPNPLMGESYYRIKQVDEDGKEGYSQIVAVNFKPSADGSDISIYPNPSDGTNFVIGVEGFNNDNVLVVIRDATGKQVYSKLKLEDDNNTMNILLDHKLAAGVYLIIASSDNALVSKKLLVK